MKITAGIAKGTILTSIQNDKIRPTLGRTRQALFDSIGDLTEVCVLDLFAGAGSLGLEAVSRGAKKVLFVEKEPQHCNIIKKNIKLLQQNNTDCNTSVICADVLQVKSWIHFMNNDSINLIFADPPYNISANCFNLLKNSNMFFDFAKNALIYWELPKKNNDYTFFDIGLWSDFYIKTYQNTKFLIIKA